MKSGREGSGEFELSLAAIGWQIRERERGEEKRAECDAGAARECLDCSLSGGVHLVSLFLPRIPARRPPSDVYEGDRGPRK